MAVYSQVSEPRAQVRVEKRRVVYLLGAGATHGGVKLYGSNTSLLMPGLIVQLSTEMRKLLGDDRYRDHRNLEELLNSVVNEDTDFEQLITFLEDSVSITHREFAADLKNIFSTVLRARLDEVQAELGPHHSQLYATLIDMHRVEGVDEDLKGFLTLNYDGFLEDAIVQHLGEMIDFGVNVNPQNTGAMSDAIRVLKLHGSFTWNDQWPIAASDGVSGLWIPPGIRKTKTDYPFNAIWGLAREMLDCDVVRVIGCNLGANDWDLVSLLFTTRHLHASSGPYDVELITDVDTASRIKKSFPYLGAKHLVDIDIIGREIVGEMLATNPRDVADLEESDQRLLGEQLKANVSNPFAYWLKVKGELMQRDLPSIHTQLGLFESFVGSMV